MAQGNHKTLYSPEMVDTICDLIRRGVSVSQIEQMDGMPSWCSIAVWLRKYPEFQQKYVLAREDQADFMDGMIFDEAMKADAENYNATKVRLDALKWRAAKLKPKVYGERSSVDVKVEISLTDLVSESMNHAKLAGDHAKVIEHEQAETTPKSTQGDK